VLAEIVHPGHRGGEEVEGEEMPNARGLRRLRRPREQQLPMVLREG